MLGALSPRRHLPVLPTKDADDTPPRPRWQWVGFGAVAILLAWLPLAYVSQALVARVVVGPFDAEGGGRIAPEEALRLGLLAWLLPTSALALAAISGGYVLARWGGRSGPREGAAAGALVGVLAVGLTWARSGAGAAPLVVLLLVVPAAALGARLGVRARAGGLR